MSKCDIDHHKTATEHLYTSKAAATKRGQRLLYALSGIGHAILALSHKDAA